MSSFSHLTLKIGMAPRESTFTRCVEILKLGVWNEGYNFSRENDLQGLSAPRDARTGSICCTFRTKGLRSRLQNSRKHWSNSDPKTVGKEHAVSISH